MIFYLKYGLGAVFIVTMGCLTSLALYDQKHSVAVSAH